MSRIIDLNLDFKKYITRLEKSPASTQNRRIIITCENYTGTPVRQVHEKYKEVSTGIPYHYVVTRDRNQAKILACRPDIYRSDIVNNDYNLLNDSILIMVEGTKPCILGEEQHKSLIDLCVLVSYSHGVLPDNIATLSEVNGSEPDIQDWPNVKESIQREIEQSIEGVVFKPNQPKDWFYGYTRLTAIGLDGLSLQDYAVQTGSPQQALAKLNNNKAYESENILFAPFSPTVYSWQLKKVIDDTELISDSVSFVFKQIEDAEIARKSAIEMDAFMTKSNDYPFFERDTTQKQRVSTFSFNGVQAQANTKSFIPSAKSPNFVPGTDIQMKWDVPMGDITHRTTDYGGKKRPIYALGAGVQYPGYHNGYIEVIDTKNKKLEPIRLFFVMSPSAMTDSRVNNVHMIKTAGGYFALRTGPGPITLSISGVMLDVRNQLERHDFINKYKTYLEDTRMSNLEFHNRYTAKVVIEGRQYNGYMQNITFQKSATKQYLYDYNFTFISLSERYVYNPAYATLSRNELQRMKDKILNPVVDTKVVSGTLFNHTIGGNVSLGDKYAFQSSAIGLTSTWSEDM